jgi:hypothetical protein
MGSGAAAGAVIGSSARYVCGQGRRPPGASRSPFGAFGDATFHVQDGNPRDHAEQDRARHEQSPAALYPPREHDENGGEPRNACQGAAQAAKVSLGVEAGFHRAFHDDPRAVWERTVTGR